MRKRYQKGSVQLVRGKWIAQWRDERQERKLVLGRKARMRKSEAETKLAEIVAPINARAQEPTPEMAFGLFVNMVYLPFYRRKWKRSTMVSNEDRLGRHLVLEFGARKLGSFRREELQDFLDRKEADGLSYSTVAHLRWDMRQIFRMAVTEGFIPRNPAEVIFIPRECPRPNTRDMKAEEVALLFRVLDLREQLIAKLAVLAGMRPGEIFALKWCRLEREYAEIQQRVYRGDIDTPKTFKSIRQAALAEGLQETIRLWREMCGNPDTERVGVPVREGDDAAGQGQLLASIFQAAAGGRWIRVGELPGHAARPIAVSRRRGRRSAGPGRADGAHGGREPERLYAHFAGEAVSGGEHDREGRPGDVMEHFGAGRKLGSR